MTTSGTYTFNYNRDQIIRAALRKVGAISAGEIPGAQITLDASDQLNSMVKALVSSGIHIWTETEATLFLQPNQIYYNFGTGTTDHATYAYNSTNTNANNLTGDTTITVLSTTGFAAGYNIGIVLDTGYIFWTTQVGAASGLVVTLSTPFPSTAGSGAAVYVYQTDIVRPLRIVDGRRYNFASILDTPMIRMSRLDYRELPNKYNTGIVTQFFYDPKGGANTQGQVALWPAPPDVTNAFKFTWYRPIQDFDNPGDTPDLPQEWVDTLVWNLAKKIAPEYGTPTEVYAIIKAEAAESLEIAMGFDKEPESTYFGVDWEHTSYGSGH